MANFDWRVALAGGLGGWGGDPMLGIRTQMAQMNMQMQLEQAQRDKERFGLMKKRAELDEKLQMFNMQEDQRKAQQEQQELEEQQEPVELNVPAPMEETRTEQMSGLPFFERTLEPSGQTKMGNKKVTMPMGKAKNIFGQKLPEAMYPGFGQTATEPKRYEVGGNLVDTQGNVLFKAPAKPEKKEKGTWVRVADKKSKTGWSKVNADDPDSNPIMNVEPPDTPQKATDFDKKMELCRKVLIESGNANPTTDQVMQEFEKRYGKQDFWGGLAAVLEASQGGSGPVKNYNKDTGLLE